MLVKYKEKFFWTTWMVPGLECIVRGWPIWNYRLQIGTISHFCWRQVIDSSLHSMQCRYYVTHKSRKSSYLLSLHFHSPTILIEIVFSSGGPIRHSHLFSLLWAFKGLNTCAVLIKVFFEVDQDGLDCL